MNILFKVFADFNNADKLGRIRLNTIGTENDVKEKNIEFQPGMEILLDDSEELSVLGIVEFSVEENIWVAKIDWKQLETLNQKNKM